ncbi:MAG: efflux RND transporter periplasmic adaptor subunit [Puniceicoccaceae bacterium]
MDDKLQAISRKPTSGSSPPKASRKPRIKRLLIKQAPWLFAAVAVVLFLLLFGNRFLPAASVEVETVVTLPQAGEVQAATVPLSGQQVGNAYAGASLFQASGWFEADPFPYRATALASGVVESVHVLEGQPVEAGEPIATLIREDAELKMRTAAANLEAMRASLDAATSEQELARARVESMWQQIEVAKSRRQELADLAERADELGAEIMAEQEIIQAKLRLKTQEQALVALRAQLREREIETERLDRQLQLRQSMLEEAQVRLATAKLEYDRMVIRAPVTGVVQRLMVAPGQKKVLMADNPESATVALLYQPEHLQARIDVPIAEAYRLIPGQAVFIESEFLPGKELRGYIQRIVGEADLQRNTLQVKVKVVDPPATLRPEILCRARFLDSRVVGLGSAPEKVSRETIASSSETGLRLLVPVAAMFDRSGEAASVWVVGPDGKRAALRQLKLLGEERDGYAFVNSGLRPGDRVIVQSSGNLKAGKRIKY